MLAATTEKVEISERFLVTMRHGEEAEVPNDQSLLGSTWRKKGVGIWWVA